MMIGIMPDHNVDEKDGSPMRNMLLEAFRNAFISLSVATQSYALHFEVYEYSVSDINDASMYDIFIDDAKCAARNDLDDFKKMVLKLKS